MAVATDTSGKIVKSTCPHCGTKGVAFTIDAVHHRPQPFGVSDQWDTFAVCGLCGRGVIAVFEASKDGLYGRTREDFFSAYPRLLGVLPPPPSLGAPRHTPKNVASFVRQAKASLPEKSWDASVIMSRKALEAALKDKFDDLGDRLRLVDRIDEAAKQGYLTSDLAKWAHHIRLGASDKVLLSEAWAGARGGLSARAWPLGDEFDQGDGQADNADRHQPQLLVEGGKLLGHVRPHARDVGLQLRLDGGQVGFGLRPQLL